MAVLDAGAAQGQRQVDHQLPLVPFIDFLLCLVAFLLVTAVWLEHARLESTARAPGVSEGPPPTPPKQLHVHVGESSFELSWRQGQTVLDTSRVPKRALISPDGSERYPDLGRVLAEQWRAHGVHRSPGDPRLDEAVLHVPNSSLYGEVVAVLDALHAPKRAVPGRPHEQPAFSVKFASN